MKPLTQAVSLHPYFKVHPDRMDTVKCLLREFVLRSSAESELLYYEFTICGDMVFCREAYTSADGVLAHLGNVSQQIESMLTHSDLVRLEVHGPAAELERLRRPMGSLNPNWYVLECGVEG